MTPCCHMAVKDINMLECAQRHARKYMLYDCSELNDLTFFMKSLKLPTANFDISQYISFISSNAPLKLVHPTTRSALYYHFTFCTSVKTNTASPHHQVENKIKSL